MVKNYYGYNVLILRIKKRSNAEVDCAIPFLPQGYIGEIHDYHCTNIVCWGFLIKSQYDLK